MWIYVRMLGRSLKRWWDNLSPVRFLRAKRQASAKLIEPATWSEYFRAMKIAKNIDHQLRVDHPEWHKDWQGTRGLEWMKDYDCEQEHCPICRELPEKTGT